MTDAGLAPADSRAPTSLVAGGPLLVALVAFVLARTTLLPGLAFWDTGEFQAVGPLLGTAHPTGFPAYVILGWLASIVLAPFGEPAFRINLLSAILFAGTSGLTVVLVRALTGRPFVGIAAGLLVALAPLPWSMGTHADPHTFHVFLVALLLVLLVAWERRRRAAAPGADRWLVAASATYGVALGNHALSGLLAPAIALFVLAVDPGLVRRPRLVASCGLAIVGVAALLYLELPIRAAMGAPLVYGRPDTWEGFRYVVLGEQFWGSLVDPWGNVAAKLHDLLDRSITQLGPLGPLVPAAALVAVVRQPRYALLSLVGFAITAWFAEAYTDAVIDRYYLVLLLLAVIWLGIGAGAIADLVERALAGSRATRGGWADRGRTIAAVGPGAEAPVPAPGPARPADGIPAPERAWPTATTPLAAVGRRAEIGLAVLLVLAAAASLPATKLEVDRSDDTAARRWVDGVLAVLPARAVVVSWWSFSTPLWYATLVEGDRPDITVLDDRDILDLDLGTPADVIVANLGRRPVYVIATSSELAHLAERFDLELVPVATGITPLWRAVGLRGMDGPIGPPAAAAGRRAGAVAGR